MPFLLDADALIKLNRAGVLGRFVVAFECSIAEAVFNEAVVEGRARKYDDAVSIESALAQNVQVLKSDGDSEGEPGLGPGESALLRLARKAPSVVVVGDDRRFLTVLATEGIAYLTTADAIVLLTREAVISMDEALGALERLRPLIRTTAYVRARDALDALKDTGNEQD